jgi:hypothetical protein
MKKSRFSEELIDCAQGMADGYTPERAVRKMLEIRDEWHRSC